MDMQAPRAAPRGYFWTAREEEVLRELYPTLGPLEAARALGRSAASVYNKAHAMGLRSADLRTGNPGCARRRYEQADHIDAAIRAAYATPARGFVCALAERLGRPRWWVIRRAQALGIAHTRLRAPEWTPAEDRLLEDRAGEGVHALARILKRAGHPARTPTAVAVRLRRIGIGLRDEKAATGRLTCNQLAALLGVQPTTVSRWIEREGLPATRPRGCPPNYPFEIEERPLRAWIATHAQLLNLARVDKHWFIALMAN